MFRRARHTRAWPAGRAVARNGGSFAQSSAVPESRHGAAHRATIPGRGRSVARFSESRMSTLEYKVILLPYKPSIFQADSTDIHDALNAAGQEGWKLSQIIEP